MLICALLAGGMVLVITVMTPELRLQISPYDRNFLSGVHAIEQIGGYQARWTTASAVLDLPRFVVNRPLVLRLDLLNARPPGQPEPAVQILSDSRLVAKITVARSARGGPMRYHLLLPPASDPQLTIGMITDPIRPSGDPRPLGVVLIGVTLGATTGGPVQLSLEALLAAGLLTFASYGALRGIGFNRKIALGLLIALIGALIIGLIWRPIAVAPFMPRLVALACLVALAIGLARHLAPPEPDPQGRLRVPAVYLPIYLGLAWWVMPLFQLVLAADGAPNVGPHPSTSLIGIGLALSALAIYTVSSYRSTAERARRPVRALALAFGIAALAHTLFLIWFAFQRSGPDFWIHFRAVRGLARDGLPLYDLAGIAANHFGFAYKWPPLYAALLRPFAALDGQAVLVGHRTLNVLLLAAVALLLIAQTRRWTTAIALLMLINFRPATDTIAFGQVDILLLSGFTIALLATLRGRDALAGAIIAVLSLIKIYPVLLFGLFLIQRRWRAFGGGAIAATIATGLSLLTFGWETHWRYLTDVLPILGSGGGGTAWTENQTFNGFLSRLFAERYVGDPYHHPLVAAATYGFFLLLLAVACFCAAAPPQRRSAAWDTPLPLQFSLFLLLMVLAVPAAWMHYQAIVILCFAALLLARPDGLPLHQTAVFAVSYALIAYGNQLSFSDSAIAAGLGVLGYSYKFYGLVLLFGLTVAQCLGAVGPYPLRRDEVNDASPTPASPGAA